MLIITILIIAVTVGIILFVSYAPQFGQTPKGAHLAAIQSSPHYRDEQFVNLIPTSMDMRFSSMVKTMKEFFTAKNTFPDHPLPVKHEKRPIDPVNDRTAFITWYGHSALLLEMEGKRILLDPMFGPYASPVSFFSKRFPNEQNIDINTFKNIDAVIISHDHYDHLDYGSILQLKAHVKHFYVPLGVGSHLQKWGVDAASITELDWWESVQMDHLSFTATPARHFSGRGTRDRDKTLWASWVIKGNYNHLYFSGDSGYGPHFKTIGEKFGPFDFTMIECGQYNEKWEAIHMMPEQSLQANIDLQGKAMMPIHWGAFPLSVHTWKEPVERLLQAANENGITVSSPFIGQRFNIDEYLPATSWWEATEKVEQVAVALL